MTTNVLDRLHKHIDKQNDDGECWTWTGCRNRQGYGLTWAFGKFQRASRVMWAITNNRDIPPGMQVLHTCDNPTCVNPGHLRLGTHQDNMDDMVNKNRSAKGDRHGARLHPDSRPRGDAHPARRHPECLARGMRNGAYTHPERVLKGESHGSAKLKDIQVVEIRQRYQHGGVSYKTLAAEYGVKPPLIYKIIKRRVWKHI